MSDRSTYGARIETNAGPVVINCSSRSEANRIRRVVDRWCAIGGTDAWRIVEALANLAKERSGSDAASIISEFIRVNNII